MIGMISHVFLTHCGMNSPSRGLYFGVPPVMLPQTSEQDGVAARAEQRQAALKCAAAKEKADRSTLGRPRPALCEMRLLSSV